MKTLEISKATQSLQKYARELDKDSVILTEREKPVAALVPIAGDDWESIRLSMDPEFIRIIERARRNYKAHGGVSSHELRKRFRLKPRKHRQP